MEFEKYSPEKHGEKLLDWFTDKAVETGDIEEYREAVTGAVGDFREVFGLDTGFKIVIAEIDVGKLEQRYDEIPPWEYGQGFSASSQVEEHDVGEDTVFLAIAGEYNYWKPLLKYVTCHEIAHQKFYQSREVGWTIAKRMLFEAHAMHSAEKIASEKDYNWSQEGWSPGEVDAEKVLGELDKLNKWKGEQEGEVSGMFIPGGEEWENAEGYPIAYQIVKHLIEKNDWTVEYLLEVSEEEWRKNLEETIREIYD